MTDEEFETLPPPRQSDEECEEGAPAWTVTFGDMMSLLLCFFVLLLSFSTMDVVKFKAMVESLSEALGAQKQVIGEGSPISSPVEQQPQVTEKEVVQQIQAAIDNQQLKDLVNVSVDSRGVLIRVTGKVMFESGKADIRPEALPLLNDIAKVIGNTSAGVIVEGHTDTIPIHNDRFPSNWELSSARAGAVVRYCIQECGIDANRFRAVGYAATHPIESNSTPEGRERNRRVEFVLMNRSADQSAGKSDPQAVPAPSAPAAESRAVGRDSSAVLPPVW